VIGRPACPLQGPADASKRDRPDSSAFDNRNPPQERNCSPRTHSRGIRVNSVDVRGFGHLKESASEFPPAIAKRIISRQLVLHAARVNRYRRAVGATSAFPLLAPDADIAEVRSCTIQRPSETSFRLYIQVAHRGARQTIYL